MRAQLPTMTCGAICQFPVDDTLLALRWRDVSGELRGDIVLELPGWNEVNQFIRSKLVRQLSSRVLCWSWCRRLLELFTGKLFSNWGNVLHELRDRQVFHLRGELVLRSLLPGNLPIGVASWLPCLCRGHLFFRTCIRSMLRL